MIQKALFTDNILTCQYRKSTVVTNNIHMAVFYSSVLVTLSLNASMHDTRNLKGAKWKSAINNFVIYTCSRKLD